jgi:integrase
MSTGKLSDIAIRNAKPADKPVRLFDGAGLYLEVQPAGGKWWRLKYRVGGKEKRLSLGTYPDTTLAAARGKRDEARKLLASGIDPSENRKAEKASGADRAANSFEVVAREWFAKYQPTWSDGHASRIIARLERDVFPWIGRKPVAEITPPIVLAAVRRIEARGALETAHRALANIGQAMRYAIATGRADRDPTPDLRGALPPVQPQHFAAVTEPAKVGELLRAMHGYTGAFVTRAALRLAPLLFVRPGELRTMRWADVDLDAAEWRFTVSKTRTPHIVPLSTQAIDVLRELYALTGRGVFAFPGARSRARPMSENAVLFALRGLGIDSATMTGHGFRAMARTILDEVLGFRPELIEHQLAHAVKDANGRAYNRTAHLPERRKMMQAWAHYLDVLRESSRVVPLRKVV